MQKRMFLLNLLGHVVIGLSILTSSSEGGFCRVKIQDGKLVSEGDCGSSRGNSILKELDAKLEERRLKALCPGLVYDNKCFVAVVWESHSDLVDYAGAVKECERRGGSLSNIYDQSHMDDVMKYIREQKIGDSKWMRFHTGMKFDPMANKATLRNGTDAPDGLKWHPFTPFSGTSYAAYTNVMLRVDTNWYYSNQYLVNYPPTEKNNVLCEIE